MANYPIGVTRSFGNWNTNGYFHVERPLDNAAYDAAHPDNTLLLAGPARRDVFRPRQTSPRTLAALGMFQAFQVSSSTQLMPIMSIGSGRPFFLRGKSQSSWSITRTWLYGKNLLRVLSHNAAEAGLRVDQFDDPAALAPDSAFFINLDSELYYIPFGLGALIRSKSHTMVAGMYLELAMIQQWSTSVNGGGNIMAESVSGLCDRVLPFKVGDQMQNFRVGRAAMDSVLGMANDVFPPISYTDVPNFGESGMGESAVAGL